MRRRSRPAVDAMSVTWLRTSVRIPNTLRPISVATFKISLCLFASLQEGSPRVLCFLEWLLLVSRVAMQVSTKPGRTPNSLPRNIQKGDRARSATALVSRRAFPVRGVGIDDADRTTHVHWHSLYTSSEFPSAEHPKGGRAAVDAGRKILVPTALPDPTQPSQRIVSIVSIVEQPLYTTFSGSR